MEQLKKPDAGYKFCKVTAYSRYHRASWLFGIRGRVKLLEQLLLKAIAESQVELYSIQFRPHLADSIGVDSITVSNIQSALRSLSKNKLFLNQKMVTIKSGMLFLKNRLQMKYNFFNLRFQFLIRCWSERNCTLTGCCGSKYFWSNDKLNSFIFDFLGMFLYFSSWHFLRKSALRQIRYVAFIYVWKVSSIILSPF